MKKTYLIVILAVTLLLIGIAVGVYSYTQEIKDSNRNRNARLANENESIGIIRPTNTVIETASVEIKVSPNTVLKEKQYYNKCDHLTESEKEITEELINKTEEEIAEIYAGWNIEKFTNEQITLYKENEGYCNQHYVIKENNGTIAIFRLDKNGNEILKQNTDFQTMYLTEADLDKLKKGIEAIGEAELNSILEDFE